VSILPNAFSDTNNNLSDFINVARAAYRVRAGNGDSCTTATPTPTYSISATFTQTPSQSYSPTPSPTPTVCYPLIAKVASRGVGGTGDEFIQVYNPCSACTDMTGWQVVRLASCVTGTATLLATFSGGISPGGFRLAANNTGYVSTAYAAGSTAADVTFVAAVGANALGSPGAVALLNASGGIVDLFGWGAGAACSETLPYTANAINGGANRMVYRTNLNLDGGNNSTDFTYTNAASGFAIQGLGVCATATPTYTPTPTTRCSNSRYSTTTK
jgi:hypothetical protein